MFGISDTLNSEGAKLFQLFTPAVLSRAHMSSEAKVKPHYESPAFKKHRLVPACRRLQERICPAHDRLYELYCRTEQTSVCYLCTIGEHRGHDTVPAETAREEKVEVIVNWNRMINQRIQQEEKVCQDLRKAIKNIKCSAQLARDEIERMFAELLASIEKMHSDVMEKLKTQEENEVRGAEGILQQVEMEIVGLRMRSAEQEETSQTSDPFEFLQKFLSLTCPSWTETLASPPPNPKVTFERVVHSVSKLQKSLEDICTTETSNIFETIEEVQIFGRGKPRRKTPKPQAPLNPIPEPKTREDFLHYSCYLTLESSFVHPNLSVHSAKRAVKCASNNSSVNKWPQALCREGLTGRCYWEADFSEKTDKAVTTFLASHRVNKSSFQQKNVKYYTRFRQKTQLPISPSVNDVIGREISLRCAVSALDVGQALIMAIDWAGYGYAALVASGGVLGYVKAGSVPSLAAGLLFGGLAGFGAYQISQDPKKIWVSLATSGTLAAIMGKRFYNSGKIMPAGIVAGASILMLAKLGVGFLQKPHKS
ncbi:hypothetical protein MHYP_G00293950 [Metynnis hypsauchen]